MTTEKIVKVSERKKAILFSLLLFPSGIIGMISSSIKVFLPTLGGEMLKAWFITSLISMQIFIITVFIGLLIHLKEKASKGNSTDLIVYKATRVAAIGAWLILTMLHISTFLKLFFPTPELIQGLKRLDYPLSLFFLFVSLGGIFLFIGGMFYALIIQNKGRDKQVSSSSQNKAS
ncbi:MAG: hypothetical protein Q6373_005000 [Candidatus Sigynarchaeota archaeon]